MKTDEELFHELMFYSLAHPDPAFLHQHVVDAFAAQHATADSKPITTVFALIGLCLYLEHGFTGRQVQLAHMKLARFPRTWIAPATPEQLGELTVAHPLSAEAGAERDRAIREWCASVWAAWGSSRDEIAALLHRELDVAPHNS